jgi:guanine deaminase
VTVWHQQWIEQAIALAIDNVDKGRGGPFAAVIVREQKVIATGVNLVTATNDPTAHAEVVAIRAACRTLETFQLDGCDIYSSCEPCPMCLGAIYWARPQAYYFASTRHDAAAAGFDDEFLYKELVLQPDERFIPGQRLHSKEALKPFEYWERSPLKISY